jgi:hypothetical protein
VGLLVGTHLGGFQQVVTQLPIENGEPLFEVE